MIESKKYAKEIEEISKHSTTVIADAMDKFGSVPDLTLIQGMPHDARIAGPVYYVETYNESNWHLHEALRDVPIGCVVFVEPIDCNKRAIFGEIVMDYMMLKRKVQGVIVNGYMRDIEGVIPKGYPLWYKGNSPVGCFNKVIEKPNYETIGRVLTENRRYYDHPGKSICVADAAGVVIIPEHKIKKTYWRVQQIAVLEQIWSACIDLGLNTHETVCLRVYERDNYRNDPRYQKVQELYEQHKALMEFLKKQDNEGVSIQSIPATISTR